MWTKFVDLIMKFEIILFLTALFIWAENTLYNLCRWHIFRSMDKELASKGLVALNILILVCAVFWTGVWVI